MKGDTVSPLRKFPPWLVPVILGTTITVFLLDALTPSGVDVATLLVIPAYLAGWLPHRWASPLAAISATGLVLIGAWLSPPGGVPWIIWTNRLLTVIAIWLAVAVNVVQRRLTAELKMLRGLLPICASCKKIRDEQGNWYHLEQYILDHSEAEFTHSLSPACLEAYKQPP
ncbi:hypothetical protein [Nitrospira sp. Kam-Ns4a]